MVASPAYCWLWAIKHIQRLVLKRQRLSEVCCQGYKNHNALINCRTLTSITLKSPFFLSTGSDDSWNHYNCTLRCLNDPPAHCKCKLWGLTKKKKKKIIYPSHAWADGTLQPGELMGPQSASVGRRLNYTGWALGISLVYKNDVQECLTLIREEDYAPLFVPSHRRRLPFHGL